MVSKRKLIGNVNDVASYTVLHNNTNVLRKGPSGSSVVDGIRFISEEAKNDACGYFETIRESINSVLYTWVVIERVAVEVTELRGVLLQGRALEGCSDVGFDEGSVLEGDEALKMLHKEHDVPIIYVFSQ